jgi:hypothetical protein
VHTHTHKFVEEAKFKIEKAILGSSRNRVSIATKGTFLLLECSGMSDIRELKYYCEKDAHQARQEKKRMSEKRRSGSWFADI